MSIEYIILLVSPTLKPFKRLYYTWCRNFAFPLVRPCPFSYFLSNISILTLKQNLRNSNWKAKSAYWSRFFKINKSNINTTNSEMMIKVIVFHQMYFVFAAVCIYFYRLSMLTFRVAYKSFYPKFINSSDALSRCASVW